MSKTTDTLFDLIAITNDGRLFYESAIALISSPQLKTLFSEMARAKANLSTVLSQQLTAVKSSPANDSGLVGQFKMFYIHALAALQQCSDASCLQELEEIEAHLLDVLESAVVECDEISHLPVLHMQMKRVRLCHAHLLELKRRLRVA
ncbi:uncharacterized protein (TIGR02284 family) [Pseudomonas duriflava]|uniref:Uncharacterized protein (TIGR02284 family) n=1 Tax=Pseudomonas duriflava TaxID=459528 RepID=A0A562Q2G5_9PSED|nr:PA2169 family four-helix-bundle protein [Pseudomonas duriflava]TWI50867.1 uncharacterized protein (TIGR02284 family) [Pseudomonas duriflava]